GASGETRGNRAPRVDQCHTPATPSPGLPGTPPCQGGEKRLAPLHALLARRALKDLRALPPPLARGGFGGVWHATIDSQKWSDTPTQLHPPSIKCESSRRMTLTPRATATSPSIRRRAWLRRR